MLNFVKGLTIFGAGFLLAILVLSTKCLAYEFDLLPTQEQADSVYALQMEYHNTIQQTISNARYYQQYQDNCELEEAYFKFDNKRIDCDEVQDYFRSQYTKIADIGYKIEGYCQEYFGRSGQACTMFVDNNRS